jgi:hypothetical protein
MEIPRGGFFKAGRQQETGCLGRLQDRIGAPLRKGKMPKPLHSFIYCYIYLIYNILKMNI